MPADLHSVSRSAPPAQESRLERSVAWLSMACAVHCLLFPLGAALLPLLGASSAGFLGGVGERALTVLVIAGGAASAVLGYRRHGELRLSLAMGGCMLVYLAGHCVEAAWYGRTLSVLGGISLALLSFASARLGHVHAPETCAH